MTSLLTHNSFYFVEMLTPISVFVLRISLSVLTLQISKQKHPLNELNGISLLQLTKNQSSITFQYNEYRVYTKILNFECNK